MKYLILQNPGHNRVYYNLADKLALAELKIASQRFSASCEDIKVLDVENIRYLSLETAMALSGEDLEILSRLSFVFALFKLDKLNGEICLVPIKKVPYEYLDNKISSLLKYQGKTNELFTKMMINVALLSSAFKYTDNIKMLDPVAGKGTTLFEGTVCGYDCFGVEIEQRAVHEANVFFKKFLEEERLKHTFNKRQIYGKSKSEAVHMHEYEYARTKEEFKSKGAAKKLGLICGNSQDAFKYFKRESFHLLVGDLPYGIVHGNSAGKKSSGMRNPSDLLEVCLPEWCKVLRRGGVVVIAWNSYLVSRQKLSDIFNQNGLEVLAQPPYDEFEHMVDKSIKRDILVAKKKNL